MLGRTPIRLALSLDLNVMASGQWSDAVALITNIARLMGTAAQLMHNNRPLLTAFDGHAASWGGKGWKGFRDELHQQLGHQVSFWPAWFQSPGALIGNELIDGLFSWNGAW